MWRCDCCGFSLKKTVLVLSVIDVVIAIISIVFGTVGLVDVWNHRKSLARQREINIGLDLNNFPEFPSENNENSTYGLSSNDQNEINIADQNTQLIIAMVIIVVLFIHIAFYITNLILGLFLFYSAHKKSREKCHLWFILTLIIWVVTLISFTIHLISLKGSESSNSTAAAGLGTSHSYFSTVTSAFNLLYKAYALWLVRRYVNLLRFNNARYVADYNASTGDVNQEDHECSVGLTRIPN